MLKSFKKKRTNPKSNIQLKKVVEKKRQAKAKRVIEESDSGSDISDSSDSDYEEILISNLKKFPLPKHPREEEESIKKKKEPLPLKTKRQSKDLGDHSNHFTEDKPISEVEEPLLNAPTKEPAEEPIKKKEGRGRSKRVVIKKYYNYKGKEPKVELETPKVETPKVEQRFNYLGFSTNSKKVNEREHMSSRIFNW